MNINNKYIVGNGENAGNLLLNHCLNLIQCIMLLGLDS